MDAQIEINLKDEEIDIGT